MRSPMGPLRARRRCCKSAPRISALARPDLLHSPLLSVFIMSYLGLFMETHKLSQYWFYVGEVVYMLW